MGKGFKAENLSTKPNVNKNISAITSQSITQKLLSENPSTSVSEGDTAETIAPRAIEASKNKTHLHLNPKEFAKARKAQKKAQRDRAAAMEPKPESLPDISSDRLNAMIALFGRKAVMQSLHAVAARRERFLDSDPAIRAAATIENGLLIINTESLSESQRRAVIEYAQEVS